MEKRIQNAYIMLSINCFSLKLYLLRYQSFYAKILDLVIMLPLCFPFLSPLCLIVDFTIYGTTLPFFIFKKSSYLESKSFACLTKWLSRVLEQSVETLPPAFIAF